MSVSEHGITGIAITPSMARIVCRCGEAVLGPRSVVLAQYRRHRRGEPSWVTWSDFMRLCHERPLPADVLDDLARMERGTGEAPAGAE